MSVWKEYKLIDILDTLIDYRGKTPKKTTFGVPLITAKIIKNGRIDSPTEFISYDDYDSWMVRGLPKAGDVVLTTEAPLGEVAQLVNEKVALAQRVVTLRGKEGVLDNTYLKYYLLSNIGQQKLKARETGTTVTGIKQSELREVLVACPPYDYQRKIASILKSLDDKIDVNRRINENLEQQAQALFKSWFVDFEPFKDQPFVESELGMIPQGWRVEKIGDLPINVTDYVANGSFASLKENVKLYQTPEYAYFIRNTDLKSGNYEVYVDKHSYEFLSKSTLYGGEVIISNVGDVGSVHLCPYLDKPMTLGNNIIMLKPDKQYYSFFLYILFKWAYGNDLIMSIKGGSAQPKFNKTDFKSLKIIVPNDVVLEKYHSIISSLFNKIRVLEDESRRLAELRDTLLPKLMSGELKVQNIDLINEMLAKGIR